MEIKFYETKGTLVQCSKEDLITSTGNFIEEKVFFIKKLNETNFSSVYKIRGVNSFHKNEHQKATEKYMFKEVLFLLHNKLIYKLSELHAAQNYQFKLYLKTAIDYDLFYAPKFLKTNTVYYTINKEGTITGPLYIYESTNIETMKTQMQSGNILVPTNKQLFESFTFKKTA